jgi:hypothetical protein
MSESSLFHESPLAFPEGRGPLSPLSDRAAQVSRWFGEQWGVRYDLPTLPVKEDVIHVARFVVARCDMTRTGYISGWAHPEVKTPADRPSDLIEYKDGDYRKVRLPFPSPTAHLSITGANHKRPWQGPNRFYCSFGSFPLTSGGTVIQASSREYDIGFGEYDDRRATFEELFGGHDENDLEKFQSFSRINFALVQPDGNVEQLRPFNPDAFGCDFIGILDRLQTRAVATRDFVSIGISRGKVCDYADNSQTSIK